MLLFLVKNTHPDIANTTRELSKVMDGATLAAMKELCRVIKYVLDTRDYGLLIKPQGNKEIWEMQMFSDSDFAGDTERRISVSGFILFLLGVPISWKSKGQKSVTLSSSEAEYVALSEAVKEIRFVYQILQSMKIEVQLPIIVRVDNVGAIYMSKGTVSSGRTKHVDVRYLYVREYIADGFIEVVFVSTVDNAVDIFTKNTSSEILDKTQKLMIGRKDDL